MTHPEIETLRAENRRLQERVEDLEQELSCYAPERTHPWEGLLNGAHLTPYQRFIMCALMRYPGRMVGRDNLASPESGAISSISVQICRIRCALQEHDSPIRIVTVWGRGYKAVVGEAR